MVLLELQSPTMTPFCGKFSDFFLDSEKVFDALSDEHIKKAGENLNQKSLLKFVFFDYWPSF